MKYYICKLVAERNGVYVFMYVFTSGKYINIVFLYKYPTMDQFPPAIKLQSHKGLNNSCCRINSFGSRVAKVIFRLWTGWELVLWYLFKHLDSLKLEPAEFWMSPFCFDVYSTLQSDSASAVMANKEN